MYCALCVSWEMYVPEGFTVSFTEEKGGGSSGESSGGPPTKPRRAGGSLNKVRNNMVEQDRTVAEHEKSLCLSPLALGMHSDTQQWVCTAPDPRTQEACNCSVS